MKLPGKAFLKVVSKNASRYGMTSPWLAMVQGRWCVCATDGRSAIMRPVDMGEPTTRNLPADARIAIPVDSVKDGLPVSIEEKSPKSYIVRDTNGTERRCPDITPPDLDGLMRPNNVSQDRMDVMVDAKVLLRTLEAMLSDITAKSADVDSFVRISFARARRDGDTETYIDECAPILIERELPWQGGMERVILMPVSGESTKSKAQSDKEVTA